MVCHHLNFLGGLTPPPPCCSCTPIKPKGNSHTEVEKKSPGNWRQKSTSQHTSIKGWHFMLHQGISDKKVVFCCLKPRPSAEITAGSNPKSLLAFLHFGVHKWKNRGSFIRACIEVLNRFVASQESRYYNNTSSFALKWAFDFSVRITDLVVMLEVVKSLYCRGFLQGNHHWKSQKLSFWGRKTLDSASSLSIWLCVGGGILFSFRQEKGGQSEQ